MKTLYKLLFLSLLFIQCNNITHNYPILNHEKSNVKDIYFGKTVNDPYRFLENLDDTVVINWLEAEEAYSKSKIRNLNGWQEIITRQKSYEGNESRPYYLNITASDLYFYVKQDTDDKIDKLYIKEGYSGNEELLYSPAAFKPELQQNFIINYIKPSWDGSKVVISLTKNDEEISQMVILDVASKKLYPQVITHCWPSDLGGVSWLPDNSGFIYQHIPVIDRNSDEYILNTAAVLYILGTNPDKLNVIFSKKHNPGLNIQPADFPVVNVPTVNSRFLIGEIAGASGDRNYYIAKMEPGKKDFNWNLLCKKEDKLKDYLVNGDTLYYLSAQNAPNYQILRTKLSTPDFNNPEVIVPEDSNAVITSFVLTSQGLFYVKEKNGVEANLYCYANHHSSLVELPKKAGSISLSTKSPNQDDLWIVIRGWTCSRERYKYNAVKRIFQPENMYKLTNYPELDDAIVEEVEVISHDGVKVPLSIFYKKGIKLDGTNRVMIDGYGAYGYSSKAILRYDMIHWLQEGGIYAVAHVRGGGEKGEPWHLGGYKTTKPNTWKDLIACTEYLIEKGYTNQEKICIWSASAGGILIGRAVTERPDLYAAAIIEVGDLNSVRSEFGPNGKNSIKEFGTVQDSVEFYALLEMDSYQHVKDGTKYPAVYIITGMNDPRVAVWNSSKFVARLREANVSDRPILFSVDFEGGHGLNASDKKANEKMADILSFALWQTGHPDFQLKE